VVGSLVYTIVKVEYDVPCVMRDGVTLRADVYRPDADRNLPVLLARHPYGKSDPAQLAKLNPVHFARAGYIVVIQDTRGRGASDGAWEPLAAEPGDGEDTVAWAAALPESNGQVCMWGMSYIGNTQWSAASQDPPNLVAIAPMMTWFDANDGLFSRGGARELGLNVDWSLRQGFDLIAKLRNDRQPSRRRELAAELDGQMRKALWEVPTSAPPALVRQGVPQLGSEQMRTDSRRIEATSIRHMSALPTVPGLHIGGWFDLFVQGTLDAYIAQRSQGVPCRLIMGPWAHTQTGEQVGDLNFGVAAATTAIDLEKSIWDHELEWFDRHTSRDREGKAADPEPVLIFVMGDNVWRTERDWPLARAVETSLYPTASRVLDDAAPVAGNCLDLMYDPNDPVPTHGGNVMLSGEYSGGPAEQSRVEARPDVLVFTTPPLTEDVEVTGRIRATLTVSSSATPCDWVVRVCDVDPQGNSYNVVDGIRRVFDDASEIEVDLWSTSWVFGVGHRIRMQVTSASFPRWDRPATDAPFAGDQLRSITQHLHLGPDTRLILPEVPR
jgi:uncharacterized protein